MKRLWGIVVAVVGLALVALAARQFAVHVSKKPKPEPPALRPGEVVVSPRKDFQFRMPSGWVRKPAPAPSTAGMVASPASSDLDSNMVTTVEAFSGTLRAYVEANVIALRKLAPEAKVVSEAPFATDLQLPGQKLRLHNQLKDKALIQFMYFFPGPRKDKIIVTCTTPAAMAPRTEPLFDACMKTFALNANAAASPSPRPTR